MLTVIEGNVGRFERDNFDGADLIRPSSGGNRIRKEEEKKETNSISRNLSRVRRCGETKFSILVESVLTSVAR